MGFKNFTKYVLKCCEFNVVWQLVPQYGSWCSEGFLCVHCCMAFLYPQKWIGPNTHHSQWYTFFDQIAKIRWCCSTQYIECTKQNLVQWSETYRKPVHLEPNWCYIFPFFSVRVTKCAAHFCTRCRWFVRDRRIV